MFYVISRGISQGRRAGIISAIGVTLGILAHTVFAACGFTLILGTSALAFMLLKYLGAIYLIFLGYKTLRDKQSLRFESNTAEIPGRALLSQGMVSNILNPKIALFFLAFLPQFVSTNHGNIVAQMIILGGIFAFFGSIFLIIVGYFAGSIRSSVLGNESIATKVRWFSGSLLIALGIRIAFIQQD
jgi:threonine/homoserine/homoserine lactone efflux protein